MPADVQRIVKEKNDARVGKKLTMFDTAGPAVRLSLGGAQQFLITEELSIMSTSALKPNPVARTVYVGVLWLTL